MSDQQQTGSAPAFDDAAHQQTPLPPPVRPPLPGAVLAAERRAKGWSIEYVASHLKLATRQVQALEEDRFDALPGAVVVRGFVRIYAKMLGIDSVALIAALPAEPAAAQPQIVPTRSLSTPFSESSLPLRSRSEAPAGRTIWMVAGVLAIACIYGALHFGVWDRVRDSSLVQRMHMGASAAPAAAASGEPRDKDAEPVAVADRDNALPAEAAPNAQPEFPVSSGADSTAQADATAATAASPVPAPAVAASQPAAVPPPAAASAPPAPQQAAAAIANAAPPATASATVPPSTSGGTPLQLTMSQDSWVEIRRADKSVVVSRVLKAGTTESFDIDTPASLVVGNVNGVTATLGGQPLSVVSTYGNNVARMNLK